LINKLFHQSRAFMAMSNLRNLSRVTWTRSVWEWSMAYSAKVRVRWKSLRTSLTNLECCCVRKLHNMRQLSDCTGLFLVRTVYTKSSAVQGFATLGRSDTRSSVIHHPNNPKLLSYTSLIQMNPLLLQKKYEILASEKRSLWHTRVKLPPMDN